MKEIIIDFKNEITYTENGETYNALRFYEKVEKNGTDKKTLEYAQIIEQTSLIKYKNIDGDIITMPSSKLNDFIFNLYNKVSDEHLSKDKILKKNKTSKLYYEIKILGKKIPLSVFLIISPDTSKKAFSMMNLDYQITDKKDNDASVIMNFKNKENKTNYLCLYPKDNVQEYYANGLNRFKIKDKQVEPTLDGIIEAITLVAIDKFGPVVVQKLSEMYYKFIDYSTKEILKDEGKSTTLGEIYVNDMVPLIQERSGSNVKNINDLENQRIRMGEIITAIAHKQVYQSLGKFKSLKQLSKTKVQIDPNFILDELISSGVLQFSKTLNPLEEAMLSLKVTKAGVGNAKKGMMNLNKRDLNSTYFGTISPTATNEYGGIGINQTLTNSAKLGDKHGSIIQKDFNNLSNSFENLSPVESLSAFFEYDDTTRRIMGNQQTGQFTQLDNPDVPLVQTGFESYIPHLVSERFSKKAKEDGKIIKIDKNKKLITIKYDSGKESKIDYNDVKARTKRGIFLPNSYNLLINEGQKIKKGDIIAATNSIKKEKLAIGKNLVVAEMGYLGMNYEDGWVISDILSEKFKNKILQKITIRLPAGANILQNKLVKDINTKAGDVLFEFTTNDEFYEEDDLSDEFESTMIGLEVRGDKNTYRSPGGKISDIVIKINNEKQLDKNILKQYKEFTSGLREKIEHCKQQSKDDANDYVECIGHLENAESLTIGGHKLNGEEVDGTIIEIYIEQDNPIINGSKFTLTSSGGKGTVQYIMAHGKEPEAAETGLKIEFIGTSLSIISRKNPSILLSLYLGKVIYFLNKTVKELAKTNKVNSIKKLVLEVFSHLDETPDQFIIKQLNKFFEKPNKECIKIINSSDALNDPAFPSIKPPFKNPITIKNIQDAANVINIPLNEKVIIHENNSIETLVSVPVGILPVNMLEHFPKAMSSTRGSISGRSNSITGQGKSGTSLGSGAISIGGYDANSILSMGAYGMMKELHSVKSDAIKAKKQMINTIIREKRIPEIEDIIVEKEDLQTLNMVEIYFKGAGIESGF